LAATAPPARAPTVVTSPAPLPLIEREHSALPGSPPWTPTTRRQHGTDPPRPWLRPRPCSLLHLHHVRAHGIDPAAEALSHRLARAVALAFTARRTTTEGRPPDDPAR
jgi:hypothetical protein